MPERKAWTRYWPQKFFWWKLYKKWYLYLTFMNVFTISVLGTTFKYLKAFFTVIYFFLAYSLYCVPVTKVLFVEVIFWIMHFCQLTRNFKNRQISKFSRTFTKERDTVDNDGNPASKNTNLNKNECYSVPKYPSRLRKKILRNLKKALVTHIILRNHKVP